MARKRMMADMRETRGSIFAGGSEKERRRGAARDHVDLALDRHVRYNKSRSHGRPFTLFSFSVG
jgi:hypothetical protein